MTWAMMLNLSTNRDSTELLRDAPLGEYLLELREGPRLLWRLSDGEPGEDALDPSVLMMLEPEPIAA
jgi:hypothetical protein